MIPEHESVAVPSLVSVLVLNWNKPKLTMLAVDSLLKNTSQSVEIIVIDNGSDEAKAGQLEKYCKAKGVRFLDIGINRFFGEGNNLGAEEAAGEYIVFLNNDVQVHQDWLTPLLSVIDGDSSIGAVGPKFIYPNGILQEAGAFIDANGRSVQIGKGQDQNLSRFNFVRDVHYVSAACILVRKSDFIAAGGFNFIYEPAYYEDTDLCFSLRSMGKRVVYQPKSVVSHLESATTADPTSSLKLNNISEINREKFLSRWSGGKTPSHFVPNTDLQLPSNGKTVGIYTPFHLTLGGGEKYILTVAEALSRAGFVVDLITDFAYSRLRINQLSHLFGLELSRVNLVSLRNTKQITYDLLISMGNQVTPPFAPTGKKNVFHCQFPFPSPARISADVANLLKIDLVVVNSEFTKSHYVKAALPLGFNADIKVFHPPVDLQDISLNRRSPYRILSVGRFFVGGHMKRQDALIQAFKELSKDFPDATLDLVGGVLPGNQHREYLEQCMQMAEGHNINFHIDAEQDILNELYASASIYWHATGYQVDFDTSPEKCEHFGISLVEAMSAGLIPIAVGAGGPSEIIDFGKNGFLFHTLGNLIRRTSLLFKLGPDDLAKIRSEAVSTSRRYGKEIFINQWVNLAEEFT